MTNPEPMPNAAPQHFHWPMKALLSDFLRGGLGFSVCFLAAILNAPGTVLQIAFAGFGVVFGAYLVQTFLKSRTELILTATRLIQVRGFGAARELDWGALEALDLYYYSTRRDRQGGWMSLTLKAPTGAIVLDDGLTGFHEILGAAYGAARARALGFSEATEANLSHLGFTQEKPRN